MVDVYLNGVFIEEKEITFLSQVKENAALSSSGLAPVLLLNYIKSLGVDTSAIPSLLVKNDNDLIDVETEIPSSSVQLDFDSMRLDLSIPQASLTRQARGEVPETRWDNGINAFMLNYMFNGNNAIGGEQGGDTHFLALNSGLNIGPWRFRNYSTWNESESASEWQNISNHLRRAIIPLKSEVIIGDSSTSPDIFDSVGFRGIQLSSDEQMYPSSLQGYAPAVRGIAKSNANVTIKQNGYVIYQTNVSPGPFLIEDLFSTATNGDFEVEIKESDGSINRYVVPFSSVPNLLRKGRIKYGATVGKYRSGNDEQDEPSFMQGSFSMGVADSLTLFGGTQLSSDYRSLAMGVGKNMGDLGAISAELSYARTELPDERETDGKSLSLLYAKSLVDWGTDLQLLGAHYSTRGYYTFADSTYKSMSGFVDSDNDDSTSGGSDDEPVSRYNLNYAKRGRIEGNISQQIGDSESIYLSARLQSYWDTGEEDKYFQLGYTGVWRDVTYSFAYSYNQTAFTPDEDKIISLNLTFPIGKWLNSGDSYADFYANYGVSYDEDGQVTNMLGVSGTALEEKNLSYSLQQGYTTQDGGANGSAHIQYQGKKGNVDFGYSYDSGRQQINYGVSGGLVVHGEGITFSQPLGDTNVLIVAPGAENVSIEGAIGVATNSDGYAVVPYASSYRLNRVALDVTSLEDDIEVDESVSHVVPTEGALVRANFDTKKGLRGLFTLTFGGKPIPFGAQVGSDDGQLSGIVSDDGMVYLAGISSNGMLNVQWGELPNERCTAHYQLPVIIEPVFRISAECR
ncbi:putative outer membrane usher protein ElfC precursor [compost metagenome]